MDSVAKVSDDVKFWAKTWPKLKIDYSYLDVNDFCNFVEENLFFTAQHSLSMKKNQQQLYYNYSSEPW